MILTVFKPLTILVSPHTQSLLSLRRDGKQETPSFFRELSMMGYLNFPWIFLSLLLVEPGCRIQLFSETHKTSSLSLRDCLSVSTPQVHSREILKNPSNLALFSNWNFLGLGHRPKFLWFSELSHQAKLQQPHLLKPLKCFNSNFLESALSQCVLHQTHLPPFSQFPVSSLLMLNANSCTLTWPGTPGRCSPLKHCPDFSFSLITTICLQWVRLCLWSHF